MKVKIKDRETNIEFFRMALNLCEIGADYPTADLIIRISQKLERENGDFDLKDAISLLDTWEKDWEAYAKAQESSKIPDEDMVSS